MPQVTSRNPVRITAEVSQPKRLFNQGATVYYAETNAVSSSDTSIADGASATITSPQWVISASESNVTVFDSPAPSQQAVGSEDVGTGAVTSGGILDATIVAADIASNAVTTAKILDANVTTAKIADANVTTAKFAATATAPRVAAASGTRFVNYQVAALTTGTDTTPTAGTVYYSSLFIPAGVTLTGLAYLIGSVGGTDKAIVALYSAAGAVVANSALAGVTVGTTATFQEIPFTAGYAAAGPALYFASVSMDGTTARLRTVPAGRLLTDSAAGVFGTLDAITPPTAFSADEGPIVGTY